MYKCLCAWILRVFLVLILCGSLADASGQTIAHIDSLLLVMKNARSDTARVDVLLALSNAYVNGDVAKEFYYANTALGLSGNIGYDDGKMYAEELIGDCYNQVKGYNEAIAHLKLSFAESKKTNRTDIEARCMHLMALSYRGMNNMQQEITCQQAAVNFAEKNGDPAKLFAQMRFYGLYLAEAKRHREAINWLHLTEAFANAHFEGKQQKDGVADLYNILGVTYLALGQIDSAIYCLRSAAGMATETANYSLTGYINSSFCDIYDATGDYDSAIIYGVRAIKMGELLGNIDLQQFYNKRLSDIYEALHDPLHALYYHKKFDSLINIINNSQKTIDLALQVSKINIEEQAERNKLEKRSSDMIRRNQHAALIAALVAIVALITLIFFIYRNLRLKQAANKTISLQAADLQAQNKIIEKTLKEKEVLLKETHHRVKNNLQLISSLLELQAENLEDEGAKNALRTAQCRVLSIATVHSKLYGSDDNEAIEFSAFASDLFARLNSAFGIDGRVVEFNNTIPATFFPLNTVVLLGIILNELITNSFKHAFADATEAAVYIGLEVTGATCRLRYHDSGPGLPEGAFDAGSGSLGLYLVRRLSKQLKGTAAYKYDAGSTFTIIFQNAGS